MARQNSINKLKGTIGDITYYKSKDGHMVREKGGVDGKRIANDPKFQRTRENGMEFGRAGKSGKLLRMALRPTLVNSTDYRMVSRLTQSMMSVIKADLTSQRGLRNVIDGEAELLTGFEFNIEGKLSTSLFTVFNAQIDRVTGILSVAINPFVPANMIGAPTGTTHFKFISAGTEIDFENETFVSDFSETAVLPWDNNPTALISLSNQVTAGSTKPLFLVLGIKYFEEVNGQMYPLKNGSFNPLSIVKVDGGV